MALNPIAAFGNAQHIGSRSSQQDAFGFSDPDDSRLVEHGGVLGIVADGMGGMQNGGIASRLAVATFLAAYQSKTPEETIPEALQRSVRAANQAIFFEATKLDVAGKMGTTLVAVVVHQHQLHWLSVGDSSILLVRAGQIVTLNSAHVYGNRLSGVEKLTHPERESLTSFVGIEDLSEIDASTQPIPLEMGDRVLLATDGLTKIVPGPEIATAVTGAAQQVAEALVSSALEKKHPQQDNVTVIAFEMLPEPNRSTGWLAILLVIMLAGAGAAMYYMRPQSQHPPTAATEQLKNASTDAEATDGNTHRPVKDAAPPQGGDKR